MNSLIASFKTSRLAQLGLVCLVIGALLKIYGAVDSLPKRGDLKVFEGVLSEATRYTRTSKKGVSSVSFSMKFAGAPGQPPLELSMPSTEITQDQVVSMLQKRVKVEYDGEREVYAIASGGRDVIAYDTTIAKRATSLQYWAEKGTLLIVLAFHLLAIGWFLTSCGLKKRQTAAEAAA